MTRLVVGDEKSYFAFVHSPWNVGFGWNEARWLFGIEIDPHNWRTWRFHLGFGSLRLWVVRDAVVVSQIEKSL